MEKDTILTVLLIMSDRSVKFADEFEILENNFVKSYKHNSKAFGSTCKKYIEKYLVRT